MQELSNLIRRARDLRAYTAAITAVRKVLSEQTLSQEEVLDNILDHCTMVEIAMIRSTARKYRDAVDSYLSRRYNALLNRWVKDPSAFRSRLREQGAIISGSTVLAFALGASWNSGDLDIYVRREREGRHAHDYLEELIAYLKEYEGYEEEKRYHTFDITPENVHELVDVEIDESADTLADYLTTSELSQMRRVVRLRCVDGERASQGIDVIESRREAICPIFRFHSSIVMNWMSADSLVLTYPKITCQSIGAVNEVQYSSSGRSGQWRIKYSNPPRNIDFFNFGSEMLPCNSETCPNAQRSSNDSSCLRLSMSRGLQVVEEQPRVNVHWTLCDRKPWEGYPRCPSIDCIREEKSFYGHRSRRDHRTIIGRM